MEVPFSVDQRLRKVGPKSGGYFGREQLGRAGMWTVDEHRCHRPWSRGDFLFGPRAHAFRPHASVGPQYNAPPPSAHPRYCGGNANLLALSLFCLSKIPELGDTVFLILKRKPVRLLQWYHHATVMLFCWLALATEYTPGMWFALTNYFVHSVMYMYFFLMTFKSAARVVKPIAPFVTIIQIAQMVWGLIVNAVAVGSYFRTGSCQIQPVTVYCAIAMYASYFWLFSQLFLESRRAARKTGGSMARSLSRRLSRTLMGEHAEASGEEGGKKVN